jgi:hypothetical protein
MSSLELDRHVVCWNGRVRREGDEGKEVTDDSPTSKSQSRLRISGCPEHRCVPFAYPTRLKDGHVHDF